MNLRIEHLPADLMANIPGILGYFPRESVVFASFVQKADDYFSLGPILRIDFDKLRYLPDAGAALAAVQSAVTVAVIVTDNTDRDVIQEVLHAIETASITGECPVAACWQVSEIYTQAPYELKFYHPYTAKVLSGVFRKLAASPAWKQGEVGAISQAKSTQELLADGYLPELSKDDALDYFKAPHDVSASVIDAQTIKAKQYGNVLLKAITDEPAIVHDNMLRLQAIMQEASQLHWEPNEEDRLYLAALLSNKRLRDIYMHELVGNMAAAKAIGLMVSRNFAGDVRSNGLCVYALTALVHKPTPRALFALEAALFDTPDHRLAQLVMQVYRKPEKKIDIMGVLEQGSIMTKQYLDVPA
ncbi:DUF4192 domain-containing protein [Corynebacterium sp. HS2168-gen11]|uniref:DUF4192 domain-containing protein n=1 Tax=Corynebacterium sp. HS2168-gen11 TaxID=2974027 RepID=UPI00216AC423|nr:DUF4192 domain-containing protein [Corynebacterium sp. HS2168-gen11]MCS4535236.1 DUF4192 domain-containing protein [Corynebacterium sp. HS2168-gen11]